MNILDKLSEVQKQAVLHNEGPLVVFAGAGSGKTRVITHRIAWLVSKGIPQQSILALTFTNKAAKEMRERVLNLSPSSSRVQISTFHAAGARWLREFAEELGFKSDFVIYDDSDQLKAIKTIIKNIGHTLGDDITPQDFRRQINYVKTLALLPYDTYLKNNADLFFSTGGLKIYELYQESLLSCNAMDFSDLLLNNLLLLRNNKKVQNILGSRYKYIMVDEYQDTNKVQIEIIDKLLANHNNLLVVGDDDQSIYSWRGAIPQNIINFTQNYKGAKQITLEHNYRCSANIVNAAKSLIANNKSRVEKKLFTENTEGELINEVISEDNEYEAFEIAETIIKENDSYNYLDTAIFYRTNAQSRVLEDALRRTNIPYMIFGSVRFYDRVEVKDILAYFKIIVNPADNVSFQRIINTPTRGIGLKVQQEIISRSLHDKISYFEAAELISQEKIPRVSAKIKLFLSFFADLKNELLNTTLDNIVSILTSKINYFEYLDKKYKEKAIDKKENIHELASALTRYLENNQAADDQNNHLTNWLQETILVNEENNEIENNQFVSLMTLHTAKGLEFKRVYITGVEDGIIPHQNSQENVADLEEERRIFYVGITRCKEKLTLTRALRRLIHGKWTSNDCSRFFNEIPEKLILKSKFNNSHTSNYTNTDELPQKEYYDDHDYEYIDEVQSSLSIGKSYLHPTYGTGKLLSIKTEYNSLKALMLFNEFGKRYVFAKHLNGLA